MSEETTQQGAPSSEPVEQQVKILKKIFEDLIGLKRLEHLQRRLCQLHQFRN